jgi:pyridoxal phosphate enzyme (YggS family)
MESIPRKLQQVRHRIAQSCASAQRDVQSVTLLAVSKTFGATEVQAALEAGQRCFGENYVQEAVAKMDALAGLGIEWHLVGPLQSNKTRVVAERFDWVHSVDRLKIAERLSAQRPADSPPLNVCLEVNIDEAPSKSGLAPADVAPVAKAVAALPRLRLRGLMAIPEPVDGFEAQRRPHRRLRDLMEVLNREGREGGFALDTLSMGMSADMEAAIAEGATIVRVGTAIFGSRPAPAG